ncbi:MAG: glycosyltransferase family 4 protein [Dehalococcoidia bacterium]|nr:glycosyltransferase family 4 protein [Dehalococcoidia bacterium]
MKVCFVTGEYPPMQGGVADYTRELASALHQTGVAVSVLTSVEARRVNFERHGQFEPAADHKIDLWPVFPIVLQWTFRSWAQILGHLNANHPDILHIQYQTGAYAMHPAINLLPLWLRKLRHRPAIVTTLHDTLPPYLFPKAGGLRHKVTLAIMRGSDRTIVTNEEDLVRARAIYRTGRRDVSATDPATSPDIRVVPIGSNIPFDPPDDFDRTRWRARLGVESDQILLSYFGFLNHSKGVDTLLEALRSLIDDKVAARLLMIGADVGSSDPTNIVYRREIVRRIHDLGLEDQGIWTGFSTTTEVSAHLLASDICVLPFRDGASFRRGTLMAALAHGLAIVSTRRRESVVESLAADDIPKFIHGLHAMLVEPDNAAELKTTIAALANQPETRLRLGEEAHRLAEEFSWSSIAGKTISIYEEIHRS